MQNKQTQLAVFIIDFYNYRTNLVLAIVENAKKML